MSEQTRGAEIRWKVCKRHGLIANWFWQLDREPHFKACRYCLFEASKRFAATRLAKRIEIACEKCGKTWMEKPSHHWRRFCSRICAGNDKTFDGPNKCVICGKLFAVGWNDKDRLTCSRECNGARHSKMMKDTGRNWQRYRSFDKWLASMRSDEHRKRLSESLKGKVMKTPKTKRFSPTHFKAKEFFVRSPNNVVYHIRNINGFVNGHKELFDPRDTIFDKRKCGTKASHGLSTVGRGYRTTWKGWMLVSQREVGERFDLLGRNPPATPIENQ